jgi:protein-disulfide isomerase
MRRLLILTAVVAATVLPASAQTRLPKTTSSERHVNDINRSLTREQHGLQVQQQNQIDNNQLRQSIDRQQMYTRPSSPFRNATCPAGSIGC